MTFSLSKVALFLGLACMAAHVWPLVQPAACGKWLRAFPRNTAIGVVLVLLGTAWFEWNLIQSDISDLAEFRPILLTGFVVLGVGCCFFVRDYLAVRGLALVACLLADVLLDAQRWHPSPLKNMITVWAYLWVIGGMWLAVSPWRARDWLNWCADQDLRVRALGFSGVAWGGLITTLALTVFK